MTAGAPSQRREPARHHLDADVVGDVALEFLRRQAEVAIFLRQVAPAWSASKHQAALAVAFDDLEGSKNCRSGHAGEMFTCKGDLPADGFVFP